MQWTKRFNMTLIAQSTTPARSALTLSESLAHWYHTGGPQATLLFLLCIPAMALVGWGFTTLMAAPGLLPTLILLLGFSGIVAGLIVYIVRYKI